MAKQYILKKLNHLHLVSDSSLTRKINSHMLISSSISSIKQKDLSILGLNPREGLHISKLCAVKKGKQKSLSHVRLFETLWTVARSSVHGIFQARILEWCIISLSRDPINFSYYKYYTFNFYHIKSEKEKTNS